MVLDEADEVAEWRRQRRLLYAAIGGLCLIATVMVVAALLQGIPTGNPEEVRQAAQAQQYGIAALGALFAGLVSVFFYRRPKWLRAALWVVGALVAIAIVMLYVH